MWIGYAHADRLLRYPHRRNLSASPFPIREPQRHLRVPAPGREHYTSSGGLHQLGGITPPPSWCNAPLSGVTPLRNKLKRGTCPAGHTAHPDWGARGRRRCLARHPSTTRSPCYWWAPVEPERLLDLTAAPVGGGKAWPGFDIDHSEPKARVWRSRGRAATHGRTKQPGLATSAPPAPGKQSGHTATSTTAGAQAPGLRPRSNPSTRSSYTLTAWRPRS